MKAKPNGLGRMYKPNGSIYIGHFDNGRAQGKGVFIFDDGSYYEGDFNRNVAETQKGIFKSDHLTYIGGFRDNCFDGEATEEGRDYKFNGWYSNGSRQRGTLTWNVEGKEYKYNGDFNSLNQFHGNGNIYLMKEPSMNLPVGTKDSSLMERRKDKELITLKMEPDMRAAI